MVALGLALLGAGVVIDAQTRLVYNGSSSAPIGFYLVTSLAVSKGDLVLAEAPLAARKLAEERGYLPPGVPLIKRIAAVKGGLICRRGQAVSVNGVAAATALEADAQGRGMPVWCGCFVLREEQFFLLQDHPQSFDGRYFGAADRDLIVGKLTPLWLTATD